MLTNVDVAQCVTSGVKLPGAPDVAKGSCLSIRKSMVDTIMPTQKDVPLLVHGRQVDLDDTELMMGDDDGFLAVVIANRLPLAVKDSDGKEVPVKYNACLVNLEGQFDQLLPWVRSVIVCAINYNTAHPYSTQANDPQRGWIARYAWGQTDYHDAVLHRLRAVESNLRDAVGESQLQTRCYVDTGPLVERVYAKYAGIGWIGKNTCILNQKLGIVAVFGRDPDLARTFA